MKQFKLNHCISSCMALVLLVVQVFSILNFVFCVSIFFVEPIRFIFLMQIVMICVIALFYMIIFGLCWLICRPFQKDKIFFDEQYIIYKYYKIKYSSIRKLDFVFPELRRYSRGTPYGINVEYIGGYEKQKNYVVIEKIPFKAIKLLKEKSNIKKITFSKIKKIHKVILISSAVVGTITDIILLFVTK